jgi:hypothetical protein
MKVTGKLERSKPIQLADYEFLKSVTNRTPKVCIPSPTLMHFRGGREDIDASSYPVMQDFFERLSASDRGTRGSRKIFFAQELCACSDGERTNAKYLRTPANRMVEVKADLMQAH